MLLVLYFLALTGAQGVTMFVCLFIRLSWSNLSRTLIYLNLLKRDLKERTTESSSKRSTEKEQHRVFKKTLGGRSEEPCPVRPCLFYRKTTKNMLHRKLLL